MTKLECLKKAHLGIKQLVREIHRHPKLKKKGPAHSPWFIDFEVLDEKEMKKLNKKFRGKNVPTDILSFPAHEMYWTEGFLGSLVVCLPLLKSQAKERGLKSEMELLILLVHGLLHLLGFDHEKSKKEAISMAWWEQKLLTQVVPKKVRLQGLIERMNACP